MGVVAVIGVVGVVYEQPCRDAGGAWVLVLGGRIGSWRTPPRPSAPAIRSARTQRYRSWLRSHTLEGRQG